VHYGDVDDDEKKNVWLILGKVYFLVRAVERVYSGLERM